MRSVRLDKSGNLYFPQQYYVITMYAYDEVYRFCCFIPCSNRPSGRKMVARFKQRLAKPQAELLVDALQRLKGFNVDKFNTSSHWSGHYTFLYTEDHSDKLPELISLCVV